MSVSRYVVCSACLVVLSAPVAVRAQGGPPPMPKPGPEHAVLKMDVGTWDAEVEMTPGPGAAPIKSKGVEVSTMGCGGLCLITDFKGEMLPGTPFHGHGVAAWEATKKVYRASWTDSMALGLTIGESTWDSAAKKATGTMEGPDASGQVMKMKSVVEYPADGKRMMTLSAAGPDGKEMQVVRITYTRRK